ncbi:MAG: hypothetical protein R3C49_20170 [Planctomycetaceae bacterium]
MQTRLLFVTVLLMSVSQANAQLPADAVEFPGWKVPGVTAHRSGSSLFLTLQSRPESGHLQIPRLANVVRQVRWLNAPAGESLNLKPEIDHWVIEPGSFPESGPNVIELRLDRPARLFQPPMIVEPAADGTIHLHARDAQVHGEKLRYEPQSFKNTVGYWTMQDDFAEWHFRSEVAGTYFVSVLQGCGKGQGGSDVQVSIGAEQLSFAIEDTGHFQNFVWREIGRIEVPAGDDICLKLSALRKAAGAVMDCREIQLRQVR